MPSNPDAGNHRENPFTGRRCRSLRITRFLRRAKVALLAVAGLPVLQATGCYPDLLGALNFELQSLVNTTLLTAINTIVSNVLRL